MITCHRNVCLCLNQTRSSQLERAKVVGDCVTHSATEAQGLKGFSRQSQPLSFPTYIKIKYGNNGGTNIMNVYPDKVIPWPVFMFLSPSLELAWKYSEKPEYQPLT